VRPGYAGSDPPPDGIAGGDYAALASDDLAAILDAEGAPRAALLPQAGDSCFAFHFAARHPGRATAIVAAAGNLPFGRPAQFERMHKWHRFIIANARYAPRMLPFMVHAGFALARRIGKDRFGHAMFAQSAADMALLQDPALLAVMVAGSDVTLGPGHSAHAAFAREALLKAGDWSAAVRACRDLPVRLMVGDDDPQVPLETVAEWREDWPWVSLEVLPGCGQFLFLDRWRAVLDALEPHLPPA
jgi:pimeloyl-ACP methyl ester carboxylesterase